MGPGGHIVSLIPEDTGGMVPALWFEGLKEGSGRQGRGSGRGAWVAQCRPAAGG